VFNKKGEEYIMDIKTGATIKLSESLSKLTFDNIPKKVINKTKLLLLDYIGYTLYACKKEDAAEIIISTIKEMGGNPESTILGYGLKSSCLLAAFANGSMGHMTELDDTHAATMSHPGDSIIAAALALGEREGISGKELLVSIISGYEAALRIGEAVMPTHYWRGFHPSATFNTFGAAVVAGKIFNFNTNQIASVMGLAGLQASGYTYYILEKVRMPKDFNTGRAAFSGVLSALLVQKGFQGGKTILESEQGFCKLYADPFSINLDRISDKVGEVFKVLEVAHKPYTACRHAHAAIDATLNIIKERKISLDEVEKVIVKIFDTGAHFVDDPEPWLSEKGSYGTRFSAQFNVAVAIIEGEEGIRSLLDREYVKKKVEDPYIRSLIKKIKIVPDSELDKEFPYKWATIVEIKTKQDNYSCRVDYPKGEPQNPISYEDLLYKFRKLASNVLDDTNIEKVINVVANIEESKNIKELINLL